MSTHRLSNQAPGVQAMAAEVLAGLRGDPKQIPCKYFYDERGSQLFEDITRLPEYYPTNAEISILERKAAEMAEHLGRRCLLIEFGSGSSLKTRILLDELVDDSLGDLLDSVLCATQAGWALSQRARGYGVPADCDPDEGWIVDPGNRAG